MSYKIWVQIEALDDFGNHSYNTTEEIEVGEYGTLDEAKNVLDKIIDTA